MERFRPPNRALNVSGGIERSLALNDAPFMQTITSVGMRKEHLNVAHGVTYRDGQYKSIKPLWLSDLASLETKNLTIVTYRRVM